MRVLVIGAGLYGRYCADLFKKRGHHVTIVAEDDSLNTDQSLRNTASLVNQARIHNGYHYPRSLATAIESSKNYTRFKSDFSEAVIAFNQYYAIPKRGSLTSSKQFEEFCKRLNVLCKETRLDFISDQVDKTFETDESAIDTVKMMKIASEKYEYDRYEEYRVTALEPNLAKSDVKLEKSMKNRKSEEVVHNWNVKVEDKTGKIVYLQGSYDLILNCSYASINEIESLAKVDKTSVKHEVCEVAMFRDKLGVLKNSGVTFMDGPFVSFMPWSQSGLYSLTSVCHTPHFEADSLNRYLDVRQTISRKDLMISQLKKFVDSEIVDSLEFLDSKFVVKTIGKDAEIDDSRLVKVKFDKSRKFVSVLSGKLDAIYEVDKKLEELGVYSCIEN